MKFHALIQALILFTATGPLHAGESKKQFLAPALERAVIPDS